MRVHIKSSHVMNQFKYIIFGSLLLTACAQAPTRPAAVHPVDGHRSPAEAEPALPNVELSDELLFEFLLTEIASQRGDVALAGRGSSDLANKQHAPRLD